MPKGRRTRRPPTNGAPDEDSGFAEIESAIKQYCQGELHASGKLPPATQPGVPQWLKEVADQATRTACPNTGTDDSAGVDRQVPVDGVDGKGAQQK